MHAESVFHTETNKESNVKRTEWHVCSPCPCCSIRACGQTTCCLSIHMPPPPIHGAPLSLSLHWLCLHTQSKSPEPAACRPHTALRLRAMGFLCYRRVPDYTSAKLMHTPTPITSLTTPPVSAHAFSSVQNTSQLLWFEYEGPAEKRGHLAHALEAKKKKKS